MKHYRLLNILTVTALALAMFGPAVQKVKAGGGGVVFTVNGVNEGHDANPGDGICAIGTGSCTLRAALEEANADAAANTINFNLPGGGVHVISITDGQLPDIIHPLLFDGTSQPNCAVPCIVISGANLTGINNGIVLATDYSVVRGFIITSWPAAGILIIGNGNLVQSNDIGFWPGNPTPLPNGEGVTIAGSNNQIGGPSAAARNVISGNSEFGINVCWTADVPTISTKIQGNYIGTDAAGNAALGNGYQGIIVSPCASQTKIGGATAELRNVISGNGGWGISSVGPGTVIQGNYIGTNAAGSAALGNVYGGINVQGGRQTIGGSTGGAGNRIAHNDTGILVTDNSSQVAIRHNSIFSNAYMGIDLGNDLVTPNDALDADSGPNGLQNFPTLSSAVSSTGIIAGALHSKTSQDYRIEFFSSPSGACDAPHFREGKKYLGSTNVTTNGNGVANFNVPVSKGFQVGEVITATATDSGGRTSEFSACRVAH